jgi:hypothetical protein
MHEDLINYWTGKNQDIASRLNYNKKLFWLPVVNRKWGDASAMV